MLFLKRKSNKAKKRRVSALDSNEHIADIDPETTTAPVSQVDIKADKDDNTPKPGMRLRRQLLGVSDAGWIKCGDSTAEQSACVHTGFNETLREVFERVITKLCISRPDSSFIMDTLTGDNESSGHANAITQLSTKFVHLLATHFGVEFENIIMRKLSNMLKIALGEKLLSIDQAVRRDKRLCSIHKWIDYVDAFVFMFKSLIKNIKAPIH